MLPETKQPVVQGGPFELQLFREGAIHCFSDREKTWFDLQLRIIKMYFFQVVGNKMFSLEAKVQTDAVLFSKRKYISLSFFSETYSQTNRGCVFARTCVQHACLIYTCICFSVADKCEQKCQSFQLSCNFMQASSNQTTGRTHFVLLILI